MGPGKITGVITVSHSAVVIKAGLNALHRAVLADLYL